MELAFELLKKREIWLCLAAVGGVIWLVAGMVNGIDDQLTKEFFAKPVTDLTIGNLCFILFVFGLWFGK